MTAITRFEIKKLHGRRNIDLLLVDNILILVGENGSGKTTVLHLFYYLLSGQWSSMARYTFEEIAITVDNKRHALHYTDFEKSLHDIDRSLLRRVPAPIRHRMMMLLEEKEGRLLPDELEMLCDQYDIPFSMILREIDLFTHSSTKAKKIRATLTDIRDSLQSQLLYLPTYRRIEQELSLIFKGLDERELRQRREMLTARRGDDTCVELVEFGMKDVDAAISRTLQQLNSFARETLTKLTFGYLGDVVEGQYTQVDLDSISKAPDEKIANILDRIQGHILSHKNKQHLKEIIQRVKSTKKATGEHEKIVCHYFTKLMAFHAELEAKESQITRFCNVCNEYMENKEFVYDIAQYGFTIRPRNVDEPIGDSPEIKLHHLSSGEKQIVSLFSHICLSGGKNYFVLIDEPELSLSVPWQRRFLLDIKEAGFCSGLVAVTHSPFIYDNELRRYARGLGEFMS